MRMFICDLCKKTMPEKEWGYNQIDIEKAVKITGVREICKGCAEYIKKRMTKEVDDWCELKANKMVDIINDLKNIIKIKERGLNNGEFKR